MQQIKRASRRKSDHIRVLENPSYEVVAAEEKQERHDIQCTNCKERNYMSNSGQPSDRLFCTNCGTVTILRSIKHTRGLGVPAIKNAQQSSGILQSENATPAQRKPKGINERKGTNPLEEALIRKGFTIIDSQLVEPVPTEY